jgi:hypothetical protein
MGCVRDACSLGNPTNIPRRPRFWGFWGKSTKLSIFDAPLITARRLNRVPFGQQREYLFIIEGIAP